MRHLFGPLARAASLVLIAGCATSASFTPARVERVPPGEYRVHVAEDRSQPLVMLFDAGRSLEERVLSEQFAV